jgi:spermidine/putrescine-binding protein
MEMRRNITKICQSLIKSIDVLIEKLKKVKPKETESNKKAAYKKIFAEKFSFDKSTMVTFCKYFKNMSMIINEIENLDVNDKAKRSVKLAFNKLITIQELNILWLKSSQVMSYMKVFTKEYD